MTDYSKTMDEVLGQIRAQPILTGWRGSIAHGMYIPPEEDMGTDDKDIMSVVVPPLNCYFGLDNFGSRGTQEINDSSWDVVAYEARKFMSLLEQGNPNVLSLLWIDDEFVLQTSRAGNILRASRSLFEGKHLYNSFMGYARAQMERMTRGQGSSGRGFMGEKRKEIRAKFGYDTKNASHLIRLLRMGIEFFETGELRVNRKDIDATELIAIKRGEWTLEMVNTTANALFDEAKVAVTRSSMPEHPDHKKVSEFCQRIISIAIGFEGGGE